MKSYKQLWLGTLGATLFVPQMVLADISGTVFRDFNANGSLDSGAITDAGIAGITVKAFNAAGAQVGATATSDASGHYALTGLTTGADYRVEFAWTQQWLKPSAAGGTAVQFVKDGATANFALHDPNQYSQAAPYLAIPQYINGDPAAAVDISSQTGLYAFPNNAQSVGRSSQSPVPIPKAKIGQIGATWGVAYQRSTKTLYASAVLRRYSGFGPLGTGGIYKIDMSDPMAATDGATSLNYIDLKTIGIPTGDDPREATGCNSVAKNIGDPAHDAATWNKVGQIGIGGITMDNDHNRLWLVNLADKKLYAIQNTSPTTTPTSADVLGGYDISLPSGQTCADGELRPWGVTYHHGKVYIGAVCDGSISIWDPAKLMGYILNFDPNNAANGFGIEHSFPLNYPRGGYAGTNFATWGSWSNYSNDSPILSGIEFDIDDSLIVGIANRNGFRHAPNNYYSTDCNNTDLGSLPSEGDVLRFCKSNNSYLNDGDTGCSTTIPASTQVTSGGITQKEYYWGEHGPVADTKDNFNETAQGGLAFLPGSETLVTNGMDPTEFHQGGVFWLNNKTGNATSRYFIYDTALQPGTMAKAAGVGDVELLSDAAPIEIGNRVWLDTDNDGIQDAGEGGITNVQVKLFAGATELATATTAADGTYYFTNAAGTNTDSKKYDLKQLQPNTAYTVKFPTSVTVSGTTYNLTTATAGGNSQIDSNAAATGDVVVNTTDIPTAGANNHSFDVGYSAVQPPTGCTSITNNASITQSGVSDPVIDNNSASVAIQANCTTPKTDLKLVKTASKTTVRKGDTLTYTITLSNESDVDATGVAVNDKLPGALTYVSHAPATANYNSTSGDWTVGTVPARQTLTLNINVTVN
ncbi:SdrD B-like domain-containing protein [Thiothrix unzii]|uniref:DUF11 domain-containing protein n=1 Tax=Thiothrix unzii TaxID=111769 RepID=A0A975IHC8_9GAMM|nr:SdrD B-like domain-containing protein [Thiothrix unzii]QTR52505.1 DUF11 domain-containing protein [Thiothrix unzii]